MVTNPPVITLDSAQDLQRVANYLEKIQNGELRRIAIALETWMSMQNRGPELEYPMSEYKEFDWEGIGARVVSSDSVGPTEVEWMFHRWKRLDAKDIVYQRGIDQRQIAVLVVFSETITTT